MASASSNRYQSRLFSFIHKQSRLLTNRFNRAWKSLQAVTSRIAPIVFYPALPQKTVKQNLRSLPEPTAVDTPIKQVLLLAEAMPSLELKTTAPSRNFLGFLRNKFFPKTNTKLVTVNSPANIADNNTLNFLISTRPQVRAIASQIFNRELVLISSQNEILDILTTEQQQVLQARIISEITTWRLQRLLPSKQGKLPERKSWLLAPVNVFSSIVSWTQRDKQQGKLNVFSRNAIAYNVAHCAIASIDRNIAKFETEIAPIASKTKAFQFQGLIWAAINYFFGSHTSKLLESTANNLDDPWLEMSDLFGSEDAAKQSLILENPAISTVSFLPENENFTRSSQELNNYSLQNLLNRWKQRTQKTSTFLAVKTPQTAKNLSKTSQQKTSNQFKKNNISQNLQLAVATNSPSLNLSHSVNSTVFEIQHTPEWIETPAIAVGYVKHPLEQLLEWLDLAMLWLENLLVKFWHWLQQR